MHLLFRHYIIKAGVFQVKYSACAECEIMCYRTLWNIAPSSQCEMKFAHIRVSEYFTFAKQIFHSKAISLARRANFVEKSTHLSGRQMCAFFWRRRRDFRGFAALHRRIVATYRLRALGSVRSLLWAVSLRQKQHLVVFGLLPLPVRRSYEFKPPTPPTKKDIAVAMSFFVVKGR